MSEEYEYYESHPEIRKDLNIVIECGDYLTWRLWQEFYKELPNVQVVLSMGNK